MGIDIYAHWRGQTEEEKAAQITGFDVTKGGVGYLREAYHGEPYATRYLLAEAFESADGTARIAAAVLRERLPRTLELAMKREVVVYGAESVSHDDPSVRSFVEFVDLCEQKERATGEPVEIIASY
jgi:hypothetical protein